jgi:Tol biopolymer transport system component
LAYSESHPDGYRVFILDLKAPDAPPVPLKINQTNISFVARDWSPDGKLIIATVFDRAENERSIAIVNVETGEYRVVAENGSGPFWLSDSTNFIFTRRDTIYLSDIITGTVKEIYSPPAYELQQANISSDDRMIFFRYLQVDADVWMISAPAAP